MNWDYLKKITNSMEYILQDLLPKNWWSNVKEQLPKLNVTSEELATYPEIHPDFQSVLWHTHELMAWLYAEKEYWYYSPNRDEGHQFRGQLQRQVKDYCEWMLAQCLSHFRVIHTSIPKGKFVEGTPIKRITAKSVEWQLIPEIKRTGWSAEKSYYYAPNALLMEYSSKWGVQFTEMSPTGYLVEVGRDVRKVASVADAKAMQARLSTLIDFMEIGRISSTDDEYMLYQTREQFKEIVKTGGAVNHAG